MRTGIEQARLDLAKWETLAAQDRAVLAAAEQYAKLLRDQVARSAQTVRSLKDAVDQWDAMQARHEPPNGEVRGASRPAGEASSREAATSTVLLGTQGD